ncbi:MAG: hypothetical protein WC144_08535 [Sulfurimonas sp.]|jgi:hypothetical protein
MKKIYYEAGPPSLFIVNVGMFKIKVPKEVEDEYADALVKKGTFKYYEEPMKHKKTNKLEQFLTVDEFLPIGGK